MSTFWLPVVRAMSASWLLGVEAMSIVVLSAHTHTVF